MPTKRLESNQVKRLTTRVLIGLRWAESTSGLLYTTTEGRPAVRFFSGRSAVATAPRSVKCWQAVFTLYGGSVRSCVRLFFDHNEHRAKNPSLFNLIQKKKMPDDQLVQRHFSANSLSACFDQRFNDGQTPKPDMSFFETLSRKCLDGSFRFSPYREKIISKGRNKYPRVLCVPSKRDQLVLRKMHDYLRDVYDDIVIQPNGGRIVKAAINFISTLPTDDRWVYRGDIIGFYDKIPRDQLLGTSKNPTHSIQHPVKFEPSDHHLF